LTESLGWDILFVQEKRMSRLSNSFAFFKEVAETRSGMAEGYVIATEDFITTLNDILSNEDPASMKVLDIKELIVDRKNFVLKAKKVLPE